MPLKVPHMAKYLEQLTLLLCLSSLLEPYAAFSTTVAPPTMSTTSAQPPAFTLYSSAKCPYAQRTWITARELGVPFKLHPIELRKDNREDWFLKLNPLGKVPTVICGDDVVYESLVINEYLCDKFPPGGDAYDATPLLPADPAARAKARIIMQRSNDLSTSFYTYLSNKDEEAEASKRQKFENEIRMLNEWAVDGARDGEECEWLCGEAGDGHMTLADTAYFPFLERIDATLEKFKGWSLDDMGVPGVLAWLKKCRAKESVAGTMKDPEIWAELYHDFMGIDYFVRAGVAKP